MGVNGVSFIVLSQLLNVRCPMAWPVWGWSGGRYEIIVRTDGWEFSTGAGGGRKRIRLGNKRLKKEWIMVHEAFKVLAAVCYKFIIGGIVYKFDR